MLASITLLFLLLLIVWQDWNYRQIHVLLPIAIFIAALFQVAPALGYVNMAYNVCFFLAVFISLVVYMSLKERKLLNPFEHYFGLGDVLFYLATTPLFLLKTYALYFIGSMIFALAAHALVNKFYKLPHVPLAGYAALVLALIIVTDLSGIFTKISLL